MPEMRSARVNGVVEFVDDRGMLWRVSERDARGDPGALRDFCLIFSCADAVRRIWHYPDDWRELAPPALQRLSWER
jgi:hypothetical protein